MEVHEPYIIVPPDRNGETGSIVLDGEREKWLQKIKMKEVKKKNKKV